MLQLATPRREIQVCMGKGGLQSSLKLPFVWPAVLIPLSGLSLPCPWTFCLIFCAILSRVLLQVLLSSWKITWWDNVTGVPQYAQILLETCTCLNQVYILCTSMLEHCFFLSLYFSFQCGKGWQERLQEGLMLVHVKVLRFTGTLI